ncbi:MAG: hypothetical protein ABWX84_10240 [Nocardioides sp.]
MGPRDPGPLYHGLGTLTGQGHLVRHDLLDGTRDVAVYEITPAGRALLDELLVRRTKAGR